MGDRQKEKVKRGKVEVRKLLPPAVSFIPLIWKIWKFRNGFPAVLFGPLQSSARNLFGRLTDVSHGGSEVTEDCVGGQAEGKR